MLDALSGVAILQGAFDDATPAAIAFDADGHFGVTTTFALDGSADGVHTLTLTASDARGNASAPLTFSFTLDTRAPTIALTSLADSDTLSAGARLTGTADPTGSTLVSLAYAFDGGRTIPVSFDPATGQFDTDLDLSSLGVGAHTLTVAALDAAGHSAVSTLNLTLPESIPLTITRTTPSDGADDVGATFKPQVFFSRPVDVTTLTSSTFYATDTTGARLAATIVPAADGRFAWLFLKNPLPGASTITIHVVGDGILASDGQALDADGDGTAGGTFVSRFTTVSVTPIAGTTISGRLLDPGDDLKPMTFDDIRAGADGALHTADDVFLHPIAGAKVYILGLEGNVVYTDANGYFHLDQVPAGDVKLAIDGRTASNAPAGSFYPEMVMDLTIEVGYDNTVMGSMGTHDAMAANEDRQEVYLPRLQTAILQSVSGSENTEVGVDAVSAPNLTDEQRAQLKLEVQPGTLIDTDGHVMTSGQVGISTVPPELVRDMLPPGVLQHTFDITIQAPGVAAFATPLEISFPNVFEAAPGTKLNFLSFDHTTGRLVIEGTATVSADGKSVTTDPGNGITKPGWHGVAPPGSRGKGDKVRGGIGSGSTGGSGGGGGGGGGGGSSPSSFDITLDFDTVPNFFAPQSGNDWLALTPTQQGIIEAAARKWESVIVGDVPDTAIFPIAGNETSSFFPPDFAVDDIHVVVYQRPMDGIDCQLAGGSPNLLRSDFFGLPYLATLVFDSADIAQLETSGRLYDVALHEMGHALGFIPVVWQYSGFLSQGLPLLTGSGFVGPQAVDQYNAVFGSPILQFGGVPVEDSYGPGTNLGHWKYSVFGNELMVGFLQPQMPLSAITAASFADLHYVVNLGAADLYQKPMTVPPYIPSTCATSVGPAPILSGSTGFHGDFGTQTSPVAPGFVPVSDSTLYDTTKGYGWEAAGARIVGAFDAPRTVVTDLTRDGVVVRDATFLADLPNGIYDVSVGLGDPAHRHDQAQVYVEGDLRGNVSTAAGESVVQTYRVSVADHQLTLRLVGNSDVAITSLHVSEVELGDFGGTELRSGKFAFAIQNLDTGFVMRDTRDTTALGGSLCIDGVTLSSGTHYRQWVLDLDSLESGVSDFVTPPTGQDFEMPRIVIAPSTGRDIDGDGLDRVAEFILGTRDDLPDSDHDGISDLGEIRAGGDPLGGRALPTGIVATLPLQGQAKAVTLEGSTTSAEMQTAYVASGTHGLAIVDASSFQTPLVLSQLDLAGDAVDVAVDSRLGIAAVAAGSALHLVDVSDATAPVLLQSITIPAVQVEVANGVAYVAAGNGIESYNLLTGELLQVLPLGGASVTALARDGTTLYALDAGHTLRAIDLSGLSMSLLGNLGLPAGSGKLFVGNGIAYVGAGDTQTGGFVTVNVANPAAMTLISGVDANNVEGQAIVANGSGLAVSVGALYNFGRLINQVHVLDVRDPTNTANFLTGFNLPAPPQDIAIGAGIAFVADGTGGLQVVNYLPFDNQGQAPTITLSAPNADRDPATPGIQAVESSLLNVKLDVADDMQVRNVELLVDGQVVANDVSFPWTAAVALPKLSPTTTSTTIQARATDTGGNTTLSDPLVVELVPDTFPPTILGSNLVDGSVHGSKFRTVRIAFSEAMDPETLNAQSIHLLDELGHAIAVDSIAVAQNGASVQITLPTLAEGKYQMILDQSAITDRAGNALGAGETSLAHFEIVPATIEWVNRSGGDWNNPANWDEGRLPTANDDVIVDALPGAVLSISSGNISVRNLLTNIPVQLSGGTITVSGEWEVQAPVTATGGTISNTKVVGSSAITVPSGRTLSLASVTLGTDITVQNGGRLYVTDGTLILDGAAVHLQSQDSSALLDFAGADTHLAGSGQVLFEGNGAYNLVRLLTQGAVLTIDAGIAIGGPNNGSVGDDAHTIVNKGSIVSGTQGGTISLRGSSVRNEGRLEVRNGAWLTVTNLTNAASGTLVVNDAASTLYLVGTTKLEDDEVIAGAGLLRINGTLDLQGHTLSAGGVFTSIDNPTVVNGRLDGDARYVVEQNHTLYLNSTVTLGTDITVQNGGRLYVTDGTLILDGAAVHLQSQDSSALLDFAGADTHLAGSGQVLFEGNGAYNLVRLLTQGAVLTIDAGIAIGGPNNGSVGDDAHTIVNKGSIVSGTQGGTISLRGTSVRNEGSLEALGAGTLSLTNLLNAGLLKADPGGQVIISGPFTQTPAGVVQIGITGTSTSDFGRISVSGLASLDGVIRPMLFGGFLPALGQTFRVMTFGSRTGSFASVEDGNPGDGVSYSAIYNPTNLSLLAIAE
ncbi:MAG TPA: Ig-like domain-containing protein [Candidatus Accumulibacter phosphatis]|nr:Ig-like domain-containing protein [Candidatus Accumulibacter phosphatis]